MVLIKFLIFDCMASEYSPTMVFGRICQENWKFKSNFNRDYNTLIWKVLEDIRDIWIINSNYWKGHKNKELKEAGFNLFFGNHNTILLIQQRCLRNSKCWKNVCTWRTGKEGCSIGCNERHRGSTRHHLEWYLVEFMWTIYVEENCFE